MSPEVEAKLAEVAELEAEARARDAETRKGERALETERARIQAEIDAERAEIEKARAELERDPEHQAEERASKLREAIARCNGGGIRLDVYRMVDGEPVNLPVPRINLTLAEVEDHERMVAAAHGGGRFRVKFRDAEGHYASAPLEFVIAGPPKHIGGDPSANGSHSPAPVSPEVEALRATVAALQAREEKREREAAQAASEAKLVAMIQSAVAPLAAKLEGVAAQPVVKPLSPLEELTLARMKREDKAEAEGREPPVLTALKAQIDAMTQKLEAQERDRAEEKHQRELEKRDAEIADLREEIQEVIAQTQAPKPKNPVLEAMTESLSTIAVVDKIVNMGREPAEREDVIGDFMRKHGKKLVNLVGPRIDATLDNALASVAGNGAATPPPTPGVSAEDGAAFAVWLQEQWNAKPPLNAVGNPEVVLAKWKQFPRTFSALAAVRDANRLKAFLKGLNAFPEAIVDSSVTPEFWAGMAPKLDELRATMDAIKAANDEAAKPKPAPRPVTPEVVDEDSGEDDENEDDEEESDDDEEEEDADGEVQEGEDGDGSDAEDEGPE